MEGILRQLLLGKIADAVAIGVLLVWVRMCPERNRTHSNVPAAGRREHASLIGLHMQHLDAIIKAVVVGVFHRRVRTDLPFDSVIETIAIGVGCQRRDRISSGLQVDLHLVTQTI